MAKGKKYTGQEYLKGIQKNDAAIMRALYLEIRPMFVYHLKQKGCDEDRAVDFFQDSLMATILKIQKEGVDWLKVELKTWLNNIGVKKYLSHIDKHGTKKEFGFIEGADFEDDHTQSEEEKDSFFKNERRKFVLRELKKIGQRCYDIITKQWDGFSMKEIAESLKSTPGTIRVQRHKCLSDLGGNIDGDSEFNELKD